MHIGIIGTGIVGQALASGFVKHGHPVLLGAREPGNQKAREWANSAGADASTGTFADAARFGEIVIVATLWSGTENALRLAGADALAGKVVIDATNPLDFSTGRPTLAIGHTDSGGEHVQRWLPDSRVVKAFNIVGNANMIDPAFPDGPPTMLIAGDDDSAKRAVTDILTEFGWETIDLGGIEQSRYLEPIAMAWVSAGMRTGNWNSAFKLLRK